jgi:hypothetical protein
MQRRFPLWCSVLCAAAALGCTAVNQPATTQAQRLRMLTNDRVGYSLSYPRTWRVAAKVVATQFAARARCRTVRVVDGAGLAEVRQSFVQLCWKPIKDGSSLAGFMRGSYGSRLDDLFVRASLGGMLAYRTKTGSTNRTFFVQTKKGYRLQIVASVVAAPAKRRTRLAQVNRILASLSLTR